MTIMMNTIGTGLGSGFILLWGLHVLSVVVFFIGVLFLILWAVKTLHQDQLKAWGIGLAVVGTIVCLLTIAVRGAPWVGFGIGNSGMEMMRMGMMGQMMERMMEHDEGSQSEEHEEHEDMESMMREMMGMRMGTEDDEANGHGGSMTMGDMVSILEGKTGDEFDAAFIEGMIPHHQGAIDMARAALRDAKHDEIKQMARGIISAQQQEIDQMKQWQQAWGYAE